MSTQQIVRKEPNTIVAALDKKQADWGGALAKSGGSWERFRFGVLTALRANPKLTEAPIADVLMAAGKAVVFGLDVSGLTGEAYLVPISKSRKLPNGQWEKNTTCELWRGVHGLTKLAYRSGLCKLIRPGIVYQGDDFAVDLGDIERPIRHTPRGESEYVVAHYAIVALTTGGQLVSVIWRSEAERIVAAARDRLGEAFSKSPWGTHTDAMLQKTAVMRATKWAPKSVDQHREMSDDGEFDGQATTPGYDDDGVIDTSTTEAPPAALTSQQPIELPQAAVQQSQPVQQRRPEPAPSRQEQAVPAVKVTAGPPVGDVEF